MPAPAVYVLAIVGTIGAAIVFKEFVYEPHIAPRIEKWAAEFVAQREAKRRQRQGSTAIPVTAVAAQPNTGTDSDSDDNKPLGLNRESRLRQRRRQRRQGDGHEDDSVELENLVAREVSEWRSEVDRSSVKGKKTVDPSTVLDESVNTFSYMPMSPTHVLMDSSSPLTPTTAPSQPSPRPASPLSSSTGDKSTEPTSLESTHSPSPTTSASPPPDIPSLSQVYPQDLDHEHGLELLSPPSSRADSPFTAVSPPSNGIRSLSPSVPPRSAPLTLPQNSWSSSERTFLSPGTASQASASQATSQYLSFSASPASQPHSPTSTTSSPVQVHLPAPTLNILSPSPPSGVPNPASPALSTFSSISSPVNAHTAELSDLDFFSDQEELSDDRVLSDHSDDRSEAGWSESSWAFGGTRGGGGGGGGGLSPTPGAGAR